MAQKVSKRIIEIIDALPLKKGIRVLEIGCGPGVAAREIVSRIEKGYVLGIDRSSKAIAMANKNSASDIACGKLRFIHSKIEDFELPLNEDPFDLAFAVRVGALDGRHPEIERKALERIARSLKPRGKLFIDAGSPLKEVPLKMLGRY